MAWRAGLAAAAIGILTKTAATDNSRIGELTTRLATAVKSEKLLRQEVTQDTGRVRDLKLQLAIATSERMKDDTALRSSINDDTRRVAGVTAKTKSLGIQILHAEETEASESAMVSQMAATVARTNAENTSRSQEALAAARAAAAKAGVFHFPSLTLAALSEALEREPAGTANIACVPGLESACDELRAAFIAGGWPKPFVNKAASLFSGGYEDAPTDPNSEAGLLIGYRLDRANLARSLQKILGPAGFNTYLFRVSDSAVDQDLELVIRFVDQK